MHLNFATFLRSRDMQIAEIYVYFISRFYLNWPHMGPGQSLPSTLSFSIFYFSLFYSLYLFSSFSIPSHSSRVLSLFPGRML